MNLRPISSSRPDLKVLSRELIRSVISPVAKGRCRVRKDKEISWVPRSLLKMPYGMEVDSGSIHDGLDFRLEQFPSFVLSTTGISGHETWGRWTDGEKVTILLDEPLKGDFSIFITGGGYGKNIGAPFKIKIGKSTRIAVFSVKADSPETISLKFSLRIPSNLIEFTVPHPVIPPNDLRQIGLGLVKIKIVSES
jgi:hypothetical protein